MTNLKLDLNRALSTTEPIPRDLVLSWIDAALDLKTLAMLYRLTDEGYSRIKPELGRDTECAVVQRYLLECIKQDVEDEETMSRWEAAQTLHAWFCQLAEMDGTSAVLARAARAVTDLFLMSEDDVRGAIEQGFLEHALEREVLRPYFEYWSSDPRLQDTWNRALEWGKAHPNYTWGLLQQLKKIQEGQR